MATLTKYERAALKDIDDFKNPTRGVWARTWGKVTKPMADVSARLLDSKVGEAVSKAALGVVQLVNDGASWSVRHEAIYKEFRADGHKLVERGRDIHDLELRDVDKTVGYLGAKYKVMALTEGAVTGATGVVGLVADIPALASLALRAANEYATYYGFDSRLQHERMFVMQLLGAASSPTAASKQVALAELTRVSVQLAKKKTWEELQRAVSVQAIKKIAEALGIRLTKAKLAQAVPIAGALVGAGFNAWFLDGVTEAAYLLYRERFLIAKYGEEVAVPVRG